MHENEYSSSEYKTKFLTELLSLFRIVIAVSCLIAPLPTLLCLCAYLITRAITDKRRAKIAVLIAAAALLLVAFVIRFRSLLPDLASPYVRIGGMLQAAFQYFINMVNAGLGLATVPIDFHWTQLARWALGENIASFALYFFITSLLLYFYRTSDEVIYNEAKRKKETRYDKKKGKIDITQKGHVFCIGTTGSGKTANILHYVKDAFEKNNFLAVIDGKGDMKAYSLYDYVRSYVKSITGGCTSSANRIYGKPRRTIPSRTARPRR